MTPVRLAEIQAAEDATRPGPWTLRDAIEGDGFPGNLWVVATGPDADDEDDFDVVISVGDRGVGAFIEMARTAVPELLAEVQRLTDELDCLNDSRDASASREIDLRAALDRVNQLTRDRDGLANGAQIFREQRDSAWSTVRIHAQAIAGAAALALGTSPNDHVWQLVATYARNLLRTAGPDWHLHFAADQDGAACGAQPRHGLPFRASFAEDDPAIDCAPCRAYLTGLRAGRGPVDQSVGYEWATRTPDGTRTGWDAESKARRFARHHPHVKVDWRQIRHSVGDWREAADATPATPATENGSPR